MIVAVHQPNYLPWLGYFAKMAQADVFVFLDDVQFSKGSFTNRVRIARSGESRWLTLPIKHDFGASIKATTAARADWAKAHRDTLHDCYRAAPAFRDVWTDVESDLESADTDSIADINSSLVLKIADKLKIAPRIQTSSQMSIAAEQADERLVKIVQQISAGGTYLTGKGGQSYQNPQIFADAGIKLQLTTFAHPTYDQMSKEFIPGLSVLDAVFNLGWDATRALIDRSIGRA